MFQVATDDYCFELALMSIQATADFRLLSSAQVVDKFEKIYNEMKCEKELNHSKREL